MRLSYAVLAAGLLVAVPSPTRAQALPAIFDAIRQGGGWVQIAITGGRGSVKTPAVPSAGMSLSGCMEIWQGHSGTFTLRIADTYGNGRLEAEARPADDIPFTYDPGPMAQLDVSVEWSERRDTTLNVWIGLESQRLDRNPCEPIYRSADGGDRRRR